MLSWHIGWKLQCVKYHLASGLILGTLIGPMHTRFKAVWSALLNQLTAECFNWVGLEHGSGGSRLQWFGLCWFYGLDGVELLPPLSTAAVLPPLKADCHNAMLAPAIISSKSACTLIEFHTNSRREQGADTWGHFRLCLVKISCKERTTFLNPTNLGTL